MDLIQVLVIAFVQGLTEFLPISSSAHLILIPKLSDWQDQGLVFDLAVHVGTLVAVVSYFRYELKSIFSSGFSSIINHNLDDNSKLFYAVGFATIPVGLAGLLWHDVIETELRSMVVIAWASIGFGLILWFADKFSRGKRNEHSLKWFEVIFIGIAQALALIPGTSRSGATITAGLLLGLSRQAAARFSFLLSIPVILLGGGLKLLEIINGVIEVDVFLLAVATLVSAVVAYLCIYYFLKLLDNIGMLPFVIYRILLGLVLFVIYYGS